MPKFQQQLTFPRYPMLREEQRSGPSGKSIVKSSNVTSEICRD